MIKLLIFLIFVGTIISCGQEKEVQIIPEPQDSLNMKRCYDTIRPVDDNYIDEVQIYNYL